MKIIGLLFTMIIISSPAYAHVAVDNPPCHEFDPDIHDMVMKDMVVDSSGTWLIEGGIRIDSDGRSIIFVRPLLDEYASYTSPEAVIPLGSGNGKMHVRMYLGEDMMWFEVRNNAMRSAPTLNALMFFGIDRGTENGLAEKGWCGFSSVDLKDAIKSGLIRALNPFPPLNGNFTPRGWVAVNGFRSYMN